jgi:hypothetical protein
MVRRPATVLALMLDFSPVLSGAKSSQELAAELTREDLANLTNEMCDLQLEAIRDAVDADVDFVPDDPDANDTFAAKAEEVGLSWTLGHVVVHTTASSEESAALALTLARGLPVEGRSRYEVPWEGVRTAAFIRGRIEESRRMRLAMLAAWPDQPHLDNFYSPYEGRPPMNTLGRFVSGLAHDATHLEQLHKIMTQARSRRRAA